jgi:glycosidase
VWGSYKHRQLAYNLEAALTNRPEGYHPDALIMRFINNNDTGDRFITQHGEALTRVATALLMTLPGLPVVYTGDEIGAEFQPYTEPPPLTWEERFPGLRDYHKRLIHLRRNTPSLYSRQWQRLDTTLVPQTVFSYLRWGRPEDAPVVVVLNFSEEDAATGFKLPPEFQSFAAREALYDALGEALVPIAPGEFTAVTVPASSAVILTLPPA